jgi:hypothetical protein
MVTISDNVITNQVSIKFPYTSLLLSILTAPYTITVDRTMGILDLSFAAFIPSQALQAPAGTTHFKIVSAGVDITSKKVVTS